MKLYLTVKLAISGIFLLLGVFVLIFGKTKTSPDEKD